MHARRLRELLNELGEPDAVIGCSEHGWRVFLSYPRGPVDIGTDADPGVALVAAVRKRDSV
ncbi:MAG: hypothetical protein KC503_20990 [Myxococcales bacterium]|nr:hypothetical protein [Myxococcales bacterium]